ncbi:hypothetical protein M5D96_004097 [Drosophila gunungcola]|uniref:Uncharacterized protein n=1 Tax=Drosophila gunungcola TaxID=103775 RepID=A0A9P9YTB1_9MUSC|nr:hypothetical protein M5D96_004097 [Drosophila gunungcola]
MCMLFLSAVVVPFLKRIQSICFYCDWKGRGFFL